MPIDQLTLIQRLQSLAPFEDENAAKRAYETTLKALRRGLVDDEADWLAIDLGPELARPLEAEVYAGKLSPEEFYHWAGRFAGLRRNIAKEQVQVVCRALGELLSPGMKGRLATHLPELAPLFMGPETPPPPEGPHRLRSEPNPDRTLAGGRPGGERPLSEAGPRRGPEASSSASRGHAHSVARSADPHADTKLSSARGMTQEREHESLSTAGHGAGKP
jgi:uncharacterized protein (DUF2267 family)